MKRKPLKILLLVLIIIGLPILYYYWYNQTELSKERQSGYVLSEKQKAKLQNGDIILRYGYGMVSDYIVKIFDEPLAVSHCGIIVKDGNNLQVVHSESTNDQTQEGVKTDALDQFTKSAHLHSIVIVRFKDLSPQQSNEITDYALSYAKNKIPFDYQFNSKDTSRVFCTELVWLSYRKILHKDIFLDSNHQTHLMQFKNLYTSDDFDVVVNDNE